jgi:hypothetical protein
MVKKIERNIRIIPAYKNTEKVGTGHWKQNSQVGGPLVRTSTLLDCLLVHKYNLASGDRDGLY